MRPFVAYEPQSWEPANETREMVYVTHYSLYYGRGSFHRSPDCPILRRRPPQRHRGSEWLFPIMEYPREGLSAEVPCKRCYGGSE